MKLTNFRQFYGEHSISFATASATDGRNVTVFHGFNGSGKTALLNAFIWCLYAQTTDDLESSDRLANERAIAEAKGKDVPVSVRLRFVAHGVTYEAERMLVARNIDGTMKEGSPSLSLWKREATGETVKLKEGQLYIDQKLPPDLYPFFFFNGERMEKLASPDAYGRVEGGIKTLLDVEIYERSMRHLREVVQKELARELKDFASDELKNEIDKQTELTARRDEHVEKIATIQANIASLDTELEEIDRLLAAFDAVRDLVARRRALEDQLETTQKSLKSTRADLARNLAKDGYLAFGLPVFDKLDELVVAARQRGELPAKVKPQFVDDLLEKRVCVCGRAIAEHSPEESHLLQWRESTGLADLEEAIASAGRDLLTLRKRREDFFAETDRLQAEHSRLLTLKREITDEMSSLDKKIGDKNQSGDDAAALQQKREQRQKEREDRRVDVRHIEQNLLPAVQKQLKEVEKTILKMEAASAKGEAIKRQIEGVRRIADALQELYELQKQDVREDLAARISGIWDDAAVKPYRASIAEDFRLVLTKTVGGVAQPVHGASTGEKQVLALSFVGSLVKKAAENAQAADNKALTVGGEYPLVMDSPFGALEPDYQRKVAEWVPKLASQVIVMASKTNWPAEIDAAMRARIGREYVLELHTSKADSDRTIDIAGKSEPYVCFDNDPFDRTVIREVK